MPVVDVIELAVQQVGLADGADFYLVADPLRAAAGDFLLLQAVAQFQAFVFDLEGFLVGFFRVDGGDETGLTKEKVQLAYPVEFGRQRFVGVDGEIRRDDGQLTTSGDLLDEEVGDFAVGMVVADAEGVRSFSRHRVSSPHRRARRHDAPNRPLRKP